jgi:hypothetical protein
MSDASEVKEIWFHLSENNKMLALFCVHFTFRHIEAIEMQAAARGAAGSASAHSHHLSQSLSGLIEEKINKTTLEMQRRQGKIYKM